MGSVKGDPVTRSKPLLPAAVRFQGAHPIAGKEKTGLRRCLGDASRARCILTLTTKTGPEAPQIVRAIWELAGSIVLEMDPVPARQDPRCQSPPHVAAFARMTALADVRDHGAPELDLAGHLAEDCGTTRIAASSPECGHFPLEPRKCRVVDRDL